jgi:hypothetical protein
MDLLYFLRTIAALATVLGLLVGALWAVRRYNIALPGQTGARSARRLALVERVGIDAKRAVVLIRRDDREHLVMIAPEGQTVIETNIVYQAPEGAAEEAALEAPAAKVQQDFATLVDLVGGAGKKAKAALAARREGAAAEATVTAAEAKTARPKRTKAAAPVATTQPDFAGLVDRVSTAGSKAKAALANASKPVSVTAPMTPPAPKRPPVRLKVTAPDGRTVVEPTSAAAALTPRAQAA